MVPCRLVSDGRTDSFAHGNGKGNDISEIGRKGNVVVLSIFRAVAFLAIRRLLAGSAGRVLN